MNDFIWDIDKAASNLKKHGVSFDEASAIFDDDNSYTFPDPDHSEIELREITIGYTIKNRIVLVFSTFRDDKIRIISARLASKNERKKYEEEIN